MSMQIFMKTRLITLAYKLFAFGDTVYRKSLTLFPTTVTSVLHFHNNTVEVMYEPYTLSSLPSLTKTDGHYIVDVWSGDIGDYVSAIIGANNISKVFTTHDMWVYSHRGVAEMIKKFVKEQGKSGDVLSIKANGVDVTKMLHPYERSIWIPTNRVTAKVICCICSYFTMLANNDFSNATHTDISNVTKLQPGEEVVEYVNYCFEDVKVRGVEKVA
jgi:hypothetical protein